MEIVHNLQTQNRFSLSTVRGEKKQSDNLLNDAEKNLLHQMAETFVVVTGGHFKSRRQSA